MFTLRPALREDLPAVDKLLARAYPRLLKEDYAPSMLVMALPLICRAQPDLVGCGTFYLVEENGVLRGAGGWTATPPEFGAGAGKLTRGIGHIRQVVTDDRTVRCGVGRMLMERIFADGTALGLRQFQCLSTLGAAGFFARQGFDAVGMSAVPLADGIDFPVMGMVKHL